MADPSSPAPEPVDVLGMCDRSCSLAVVASRRPRTALAPRLRTALGLHLHRSLRRPASQQAGRGLPEARGRGTARWGAQVRRGTPCPDVAAERPHGAQGAPARASCRAHGLRGAGFGPRGGWVFANPTGGPLDPRADARAFKLLCAKADVPAQRLHDLSHSAATMMLENELDLRTAGAVLGHSQVSQTARYSHVLADRKAVAAERIEHAPFGTRATALEKYCSRDAELRASHCPAGTRTSAHVSRIVVKTVVSPGSGLPQILPRGPEQVVPAPPRGLEPLTRRLEGGRSIL